MRNKYRQRLIWISVLALLWQLTSLSGAFSKMIFYWGLFLWANDFVYTIFLLFFGPLRISAGPPFGIILLEIDPRIVLYFMLISGHRLCVHNLFFRPYCFIQRFTWL